MLRNSNPVSSLNPDIQVLRQDQVDEIDEYFDANQAALRPRLEEIRDMLNQIV